MFQHGDHHGPNMKALFAELKRRGLAYDEMPVRLNKDNQEVGFMAIAERTSGYTVQATDAVPQDANKDPGAPCVNGIASALHGQISEIAEEVSKLLQLADVLQTIA